MPNRDPSGETAAAEKKPIDSSPKELSGERGEGADSHAQIAARVAALKALNADGVPYVVAGAYAVREYAGIWRDTKDLDIFCKREDYPAALRSLTRIGFSTEITDPLWIVKGFADDGELVDVIFSSGNGIAQVDDLWLSRARKGTVLGQPALIAPPEEIIWSKSFVQERERYDGADVQHMIRYCADFMDWEHLFRRMAPYAEILLAHLLLFRFSFPAEKDKVPGWLFDRLIALSREPCKPGQEGLCRGTLMSRVQYEVDLQRGLQDARPVEVPAWRKYKVGSH